MSRQALAFIIVVFPVLAHTHTTLAALVISDLSLSTTTLSFRLSGTIGDVINENALDQNIIYIGEPDNAAWYLGPGPPNDYLPASWAPEPGTLGLIAPAVNQSRILGDYILLIKGSGPFVATDEIDGVFEATTNNLFDPDAADLSNWIVTIGYINETRPDTETAVGGVVPEPTSFAVLLLGFSLFSRRRRDRVETRAFKVPGLGPGIAG